MDLTFKLQGMKELEQVLGRLPSATSKNVVRRASKEALEPAARKARSRVRVDTGQLLESINVSERLNRPQKAKYNKQSDFEMHMGPSGVPQGITEEFGTLHQPAHPFMRPTWDEEAVPILDRVGAHLGNEIMKAARRQAKKG
jgi:HK97 gp10 family phage protein